MLPRTPGSGYAGQMVSCLLVLMLAAAAFAGDDAKGPDARREKCPVCGMFVSLFADWNATIVFTDSTRAVFDGSKDMFKYVLELKTYNAAQSSDTIKTIVVKDYVSKKETNALTAFYVIWSDIYGPMGNEPIPFEKEADAKRFLQEHHGKKILNFRDITPELLYALDNPG